MRPEEAARIHEDFTIVDVRNPDELEVAQLPFETVNMPLGELSENWRSIPREKPILTLCHHGVRSQKAALFLISQGVNAISIDGGIDAWSLTVDHNIPRY